MKMKKACLSLTLLVLLSGSGKAEGFHGIHSPNGVDVWAVGVAGGVFHSLDGGDEWQSLTLGSSDLNAVRTWANRIWMVGDQGTYFASADNGYTWSSTTLASGRDLHSLYFLDGSTGWAVGDSGTILKSTDGGVNWAQLPSSTVETINDIVAVDPLTLYAVGTSGFATMSVDGGMTWTDMSDGLWTKDLNTVDAAGDLVYVAGQDGFCRKSSDAGESWVVLDVPTDSKSDATDIHLRNEDHVFVTGGGGFIRETTDGGITNSWKIHPLHARISSLFFFDDLRGWACTNRNNVVLRTSDGGVTWLLPTGTIVNDSWSQRLNASSSIGNTFMINPWNEDYVYVALGRFIYMSDDRGQTWSQTATISSGGSGSTHSFYISASDTNVYVAAYTGGGDHIRKSTDRGLTWTETININFSSYGMPLEMDGSNPETLVFGPEDGNFYRSADFGSTWETVSTPNFSSPCDIAIVRDSSKIIWVGDSSPGRISRSTDGGITFTEVRNVGSAEIPTIAHGNQSNNLGFATAWGSGGLQKTTDYGLTWSVTSGTGSTWGVDVAKDDPNVVMFGVYGGGQSYLSTNAGTSFSTSSLNGSNYAILAYDRETFLAQQSSGVFSYSVTYTVPTTNVEAMVLLGPNGGEEWEVGREEEITWTSSNVGMVDIFYTVDGGQTWDVIAEDVSAGDGAYGWIVPNLPTTEARIRISDSDDGVPVDSSDGTFSIMVATVAVDPESLSFGTVLVGEGKMDTVRVTNNGTTVLVVTSVETGRSEFVPGRTSFTIGAGESDTLSVWFYPGAVGAYLDTLVMTTNAPGGTEEVILTGVGESTVAVDAEEVLPQSYVLEQNYPNPFNPETEIRYGLPEGGRVVLRVYTMLGEEVSTLVDAEQPAGWHTVSFGGTELSSGLYLYRLEASDFVSIKKMILLK